MGLRVLSTVLLIGTFVLLLASGTQREKPVLASTQVAEVQSLEHTYATNHDPTSLRDLAQAYLDDSAPGLAMSVIDDAPLALRSDPRVQHTYARALIDSGRASQALPVERAVVTTCESMSAAGCDAWLLASATRRIDILTELGKLGVDDALAHPESASLAYHAATRQARFVAQ